MKVAFSSVVLAALLGLVAAKVELTNSNFNNIEAGSTFDITWHDAEGPVTLTLKSGPRGDLKTIQTITTNAAGGSFSWAVDPSLPAGQYAIMIDDGSDVNYSIQFPVASTVDPTSSASSSATASSTSTTASPSSTTSSESTSTEASSTSTSSEPSSTASTSSESSTSSTDSTTVSTVTRTTSSSATPTESSPSETTVPNTNDAHSMVAPIIPGILALLGVAIL